MKHHILRAPETDRKLIEIPTTLADLEDGARAAFGLLERVAAQTIANFTVTDIVMDTTTELLNMTTDGTGLVVSDAGLYQLVFSIIWAGGPIATARQSISVNGAAVASTVSTGVGAGGEARASVIIRLAAGDTVRVLVLQNSGAPVNVSNATIQALKVAP